MHHPDCVLRHMKGMLASAHVSQAPNTLYSNSRYSL